MSKKNPKCMAPPSAKVTVEQDDPPALHGMVLFGNGPFYISHLPMRHAPHNYQAIFEVEVDDALKSDLVQKQSGGFLTIAPNRFVLPKMANELGEFKASIFQGSFEQAGAKPFSQSQFKIKRVVYFKRLPLEKASREPNDSYIGFGDSKQFFIAKKVQDSGSDFDQLSQVQSAPDQLQKIVQKDPHLLLAPKRNGPIRQDNPIIFKPAKGKALEVKALPFYFFDEDLK